MQALVTQAALHQQGQGCVFDRLGSLTHLIQHEDDWRVVVHTQRSVGVELGGLGSVVHSRHTEVTLVHDSHVKVHLAVVGEPFTDRVDQG